jgi:hypothetical protein
MRHSSELPNYVVKTLNKGRKGMATCRKCLSYGDFVTLGGRSFVICSNPLCGGGGSANASTVRAYKEYARSDDSFCRPTTCPRCKINGVFFIRHNGGSVYMDPPLGKPWQVHGCFEKEKSGRVKVAGDVSTRQGSYGVVRGSWPSYHKTTSFVELELEGRPVLLRVKNTANFFVGKVVLYEKAKGMLTLADQGALSFRVLNETYDGGVFTCPFCKTSLTPDHFLEHLRMVHTFDAE